MPFGEIDEKLKPFKGNQILIDESPDKKKELFDIKEETESQANS